MAVYGYCVPKLLMFITYTPELTNPTCRPCKKSWGMATFDQNNDTTVLERQSHLLVKPIAPRGGDLIERETMEISLSPEVEPNLEIDEDVIEEMAKEADGVEALVQPDQEERESILLCGWSKMSAQRPRWHASLSEEILDEVRNPLPKQMYPPSPSEP